MMVKFVSNRALHMKTSVRITQNNEDDSYSTLVCFIIKILLAFVSCYMFRLLRTIIGKRINEKEGSQTAIYMEEISFLHLLPTTAILLN
jgi:hypothetical protein